jgi:glucose/arabinose dehydrogenase
VDHPAFRIPGAGLESKHRSHVEDHLLVSINQIGYDSMITTIRHAILVFGLAALGALRPESVAVADGEGARPSGAILKGKDALGDWTTDAPSVRRKITVADLATPYDTPSANNFPRVVKRPEGAWPKAPEGFVVAQFADGLTEPRVIVRAPNGDLFVTESRAGRLRVLRDADGDGKPELNEIFATRLERPFGIAFYPPGPEPEFLYVGNTGSVVRFPYRNGDTRARGEAEMIVMNIPTGRERVGGGGHWTRDLQFSPDGKTLYVSVGSRSNVDDDASEKRRADILAFDPDGKNERTFASGIRNPVGLAIHPKTGQLWTSVNERDGLGDNLVPDYITHVEEGGFYGWPWYYIGPNQDPRHQGKHPELKEKVIVPDVLLQSHSASLDMTFYDGAQFPAEYRLDAFAAEHGSWNRARRTGYKVIRVPMNDGKASGEYEDFLVGFVTDEGNVWGRPVGLAVAADGSLLVTDDGSGTIWRVAYTGKK